MGNHDLVTNVLSAMARNEDPRPGRWILPIVIIGMVGFTYFFVQTLDASEETPTSTTTPIAATTTTSPGATPTTAASATTTSPPAEGAEAYVTEVLAKQTEADELQVRLARANDDWENRATTGVTFAETEAAFTEVLEDTQAFAESVRQMAGPPAGSDVAAQEHANMVEAAGRMETAATDSLAGLRAPDDGSLRRAAVEDYLAAVDELAQAADNAITAVGG